MLTGNKVVLRPRQETDLLFFTEIRNDIILQSQLMARLRGGSGCKLGNGL
jgi:hypothetical protein